MRRLLVLFLILCCGYVMAEHVYDIRDYTSNDDRSCRGWRLYDYSGGQSELLRLSHYSLRASDRRELLLAPQQGWGFEARTASWGGPSQDDIESLFQILSVPEPIVAKDDKGLFGLMAYPRGWVSTARYESLKRANEKTKYWRFKQGREVGLIDASGNEVMRWLGEEIQAYPNFAMVVSDKGAGLWSLQNSLWILPPSKQTITEDDGLFVIEREGLKTFLTTSLSPASALAFREIVTKPNDFFVFAFADKKTQVFDKGGRLWFEADGGAELLLSNFLKRYAPEENSIEAELARLDGDLPYQKARIGFLNLPSVKIFHDRLFIKQEGAWISFELSTGKRLGVFEEVVLPSRLVKSPIFWAHSGDSHGFFDPQIGWIDRSESVPLDYDYPAWAIYPGKNSVYLDEIKTALPRRAFAHFEDEGLGGDGHLVTANGERWSNCGMADSNGYWKSEDVCYSERRKLDERENALEFKASGLSYLQSPVEGGEGVVQMRFANGQVSAIHQHCYLESAEVLACISPIQPERLRLFGNDDLYPFDAEGHSNGYSVYRTRDGVNITPPGIMATEPRLIKDGSTPFVEMKTTEVVQHWTTDLQTLRYQLDCSQGAPRLIRGNGQVLWSYHPKKSGFYGAEIPAFIRDFNQSSPEYYP